ncbi:PAS domain-containing sensor histidine kinase [Duganella sp. Leaf126]|uniref:sensor histidine kinase n=1 Tax=Duganella sp. Leaf126 TaxID=1736266 RepID=UPI0006F894F4|nr:ATP-binding protein [Duganella sp. Leaf126]KQQ47346.1 PAS domain-containing sensor histidine kinase [Duganella sp. Leaf126]
MARLLAAAAAPGDPTPARATFWRSLQTLNATRIVIALVLLLYLRFDGGGLRVAGHHLYLWTCLTYLALAIAFALTAVYGQRRFLVQLLVQIACDLAIISLLYADGGGLRSGLAILYLFPLAGAAILAPLVLALFCTALVALFMLGMGVIQVLEMEGEHILLQSGLYGAAYFAAVLCLNRMAARLIGQEELAIRRGVEIGVQQAVNRLVMADVADGVLVVDAGGHILASNPAAQQMLGLSAADHADGDGDDHRDRDGDLAAVQSPLALAYAEWRADPALDTAFITLKPYFSIRLKARFAAVDLGQVPQAGDDTGETCASLARSVIFLQQVSEIEERAQQLKLASMGRLTASIAHEVRNPLSAIGHASALLAEDIDDPGQRRLLRIVDDNVKRVNRIVEDILQLSRKSHVQYEPLALDSFLVELREEFIDTEGVPPDVIAVSVAPGTTVHFNPLHLREVIANLVGNALRYASGAPASIRLDLVRQPNWLELHVQDDGPGISGEVRAHLFEPFYTTSSKGTGLGLYLAREMCLNNDARLDYEYRFDSHGTSDSPAADRRSGGRFVITFAPPQK